MENIIIKMENISKSFAGIKALDDVHLELKKGEVHALMGENGAGKSTMMKILMGIIEKDSGKIWVNDGEGKFIKVDIRTPLQAQQLGISMVFQEFNLLENMNIAENIFLGREPVNSKHCIDTEKLQRDATAELQKVKLNINPKTLISDLSCGTKQLVEIAKCLSFQAKVIILDEPTSCLTDHETEILFNIIKKLKADGISIVYISHKMEEVFELADRLTVFRDGHYIDTVERPDFDEQKIIKMMIGRELDEQIPRNSVNIDSRNIALEVKNIKIFQKGFSKSNPINFKLYKKEILGFFGLVGAGRTELSRVIFGIDPIGDGEIYLNGSRVSISCPRDAINAGIGLVPEDRKDLGLILGMSVKDNILLPKLGQLKSEILNKSQLNDISGTYVQDLSIALINTDEEVRSLSGGNQQKVVIAKWLAMAPNILILDEPTRGIDVGAKSEIYNIMRRLTKSGVSIIMISSDMNEIMKISDRVIVMHEGNITGEMTVDKATQEGIMKCAIGGKQNGSCNL